MSERVSERANKCINLSEFVIQIQNRRVTPTSYILSALVQRFSPGAPPQELLKHALPDYLVGALALFPSHCQIEKLHRPTQQLPSGVNALS